MTGTVKKIAGLGKAPTMLDDASQYDSADLIPHKGHFHKKDGTKLSGQPGTYGGEKTLQDTPPDEEDVIQESIKAQRKSLKRGKAKTSSANTMLSTSGGTASHRLG